MTLDDAQSRLEQLDVPDFLYAINSLGNGDCSGIMRQNDRWITFFSERGSMWDVVEHESEHAACLRFLNDVSEDYETYFSKPLNLDLNSLSS